MKSSGMVLGLLAVLLAGCGSPASPPVTPATRPPPPAPPAPPVVWRADFADLAHWQCDGREPVIADGVLRPGLAPGQRCTLTWRQPIVLRPRHHYRFWLALRMAPAARRKSAVLIEHGNRRQTLAPLRPVPHTDQLEPPPAWTDEPAFFVTPGDLAGVRPVLAFSAEGPDLGLPLAVRRAWIEDLGAIPMLPEPGPNLQPDPGFETPAVGAWPEGLHYVDAAAAHNGEACGRFAGPGRALVDLAGAFVQPPVLVRLRLWARGDGRLRPICRRMGPSHRRLAGIAGPEFELTGDWQEVVWEVGIPDSRPPPVTFHFVLDLHRGGDVYVDDVEVRILSADGIRYR